MRHLLVIVLLAGVARGETRVRGNLAEALGPDAVEQGAPLIRFGRVANARLDRVALVVRPFASTVRVTISFRLETRLREPQNLEVPIELSGDIEVTGLAIAIGQTAAISATLEPAAGASAAYREIVERGDDPALLEHVATQDGIARYRLSAFPVSQARPATLTVDLTLPRTTQLVLAPGPHRLARVDLMIDELVTSWTHVRAPRRLAVPIAPATWMEEDPTVRSFVDATRSLFAGWTPTPARPLTYRRVQLQPHVAIARRREEVEELAARHGNALAHCFAYGREVDRGLSPVVDLAIAIAPDGRVRSVEITGDMNEPVTRWCIADEIENWSFTRSTRPRVIHHAIDLRRVGPVPD